MKKPFALALVPLLSLGLLSACAETEPEPTPTTTEQQVQAPEIPTHYLTNQRKLKIGWVEVNFGCFETTGIYVYPSETFTIVNDDPHCPKQ